jgi:hypothetical protein
MFFFEKKNQKTFAHLVRCVGWTFVVCFLGAADNPPAKPPPPHTEQVPPERASGVLGADVHGPDGQTLGRIIDVLVDETGNPRAAVIDFGGFLGMGSRRIAVSWTNLHFSPAAKDGMLIKLDLSADQIKAAPTYQEASPASVVVAKPK